MKRKQIGDLEPASKEAFKCGECSWDSFRFVWVEAFALVPLCLKGRDYGTCL